MTIFKDQVAVVTGASAVIINALSLPTTAEVTENPDEAIQTPNALARPLPLR
jgi:hypothetical protein